MAEFKPETCFTCEKRNECRAYHTINVEQHPVPCVHYQRETDTKLEYHDRHVWKRSSTNYSHMMGVSGLAWCTKCGAEGCSSGPPSNRCYDRVVVKTYPVGGMYKNLTHEEYLKQRQNEKSR